MSDEEQKTKPRMLRVGSAAAGDYLDGTKPKQPAPVIDAPPVEVPCAQD